MIRNQHTRLYYRNKERSKAGDGHIWVDWSKGSVWQIEYVTHAIVASQNILGAEVVKYKAEEIT